MNFYFYIVSCCLVVMVTPVIVNFLNLLFIVESNFLVAVKPAFTW